MTEALTRSRTRVAGFADPELDFQLLRQLGSAAYGGASIGETLAVAAQIGDDGGPAAWVSAFAALGDRQRDDADERAAAAHRASAAGRQLVACNSYRAAEYFAPVGSAEHQRLGQASERAFAAAMQLSDRPYERLHVTVDGLRLPGYWFPALGAGASNKRVLVATSGFDGTTEETFLQVGREALHRGWSLLLIAGPGQADTARAYPDAAFVPDTERWISPWIDIAVARAGDAAWIALLGISFGGYFALRAAAAEPRIDAVVANSPVIDLRSYMTSFVGFDPEQVLSADEDFGLAEIEQVPDEEMPPPVKAMARSMIKRFGQPTILTTFSYLRRFTVDPAAITVPALAMVGDGEGAEPIAQFERFIAGAGGAVCARRFTVAEGADGHCQLGNLPLSNAVLFDWLDGSSGRRARRAR